MKLSGGSIHVYNTLLSSTLKLYNLFDNENSEDEGR